MAAAHVIETLSFEIDFPREAEAQAQHMRFGDFAAGRGVAVIGEVFDEFAGEGEMIRLDQLEVDLGETPADWTEAEAEQRLREAVRRALSAAIGERRPPGLRGRPPPAADPAADARAELEMVWGHLHHGLLPWSADPANPELFDALVTRVAATRGAELAARLRASPALARLLARMARQWPDEALAALARSLTPPSAGSPTPRPVSADRRAEALVSVEAWEARLLALVMAADTPAAETGRAPRPPPPVVSDARWPSLINGPPAAVRARLRAAGAPGEARARLAALLTEPRRRQVLGLWAAPADADFILALLAEPGAWRLGATLPAAVLDLALRRGLLDHLLADGREALDVAACVEALVAARALADGLSPQIVARALVSAWPTDGAAGAVAARLRAALAARLESSSSEAPGQAGEGRRQSQRTPPPPSGRARRAGDLARRGEEDGPDSAGRRDLSGTGPPDRAGVSASQAGDRADATPPQAAAPPAQRAWRFAFDEAAADDPDAAPRDAPWRRQLALEPAGLAAHLRRLGRSAAWRRRLARDLTPARLGEILSLLAEPAEAAFIAAVVTTVEPWRIGTAHAAAAIALRLREWLLDDLLLAPPGPPRAARDLVAALVRRRAAYDDLSPAEVARALAATWPDGGEGAAHREPLLQVMAEIAEEAGPAPAATATADQAVPLGSATADAAAPDAQPERPDLARQLEAALAGGALAADTAAILRTALARDRRGTAAALRDRGVARPGLSQALADALPPALLFALAQSALSEAQVRLVLALAAPSEPPAAGRAFWAAVLAGAWQAPEGRAFPGEAAPPQGVESPVPGEGPLGAFLRRLLRAVPPAQRRDRLQALRRAGAYLRDDVIVGPLAVAPDALPDLAAWRGQLPARTTAAAARALAALLTPAATGLRQLAAFPEAERRALVLALRPADAGPALGALDVLAQAARSVSLAEPPGGWAEFTWRTLLRELFEEGRGFDLPGLAARWFEAWVAAVPAGDDAQARRRLTLALEAARVAPAARALETGDAAGRIPAGATDLAQPDAGPLVAPPGDDKTAQPQRADRAAPLDAPGASPQTEAPQAVSGASPARLPREDAATGDPTIPPPVEDRTADAPRGAGSQGLELRRRPPDPTRDDAGSAPREAEAPGDPRGPRTTSAQATNLGADGRPADLDAQLSAQASPGGGPPRIASAESPLTAPRADTAPGASPEAGRAEGPSAARAEAEAPTSASSGDPPLPDRSPPAPRAAATETADPLAAAPALPPVPRPDPAALAAALRPASAPASDDRDPDAEPAPDDTLYVANAGLVLAGPYIPMLLNRLGLARDGRFVDEAAQERAVHLLQFLVDGEDAPAAEPRLALNKLVCGLDFLIPVGRDFEIAEPERAMIESLLRTMIQRWEILGRTSIAGLRETFLVRQGALSRTNGEEGEAWRLVVEPRPFDMLLDRIPWGYGTLKLPWMPQVLHVDWR